MFKCRCVALSASALACVLVTPAVSAGDASFRLDGKSVGESAARSGAEGGGCSAMPSPAGVTECFSSEVQRDQRIAADLRAKRLPPGFAGMPTPEQQQQFEATGNANSKSRGRRTARVAGCGSTTHLHLGYDQTGGYSYFAVTEVWQNFDSTFNNAISSDTTSNWLHAAYHDQGGGHGHYYGNAWNFCHVDNDLRRDAFPDGGNWDNRFTSYWGG
jgi:hypothetical protein